MKSISSSSMPVCVMSLLWLIHAPTSILATPAYMSRLPNGGNVQVAGSSWSAVGHQGPRGGSLNDFGRAFRAAGYEWTTQLCQEDTDGDGQTNGQELGDPDCVWTVGSTPSRTTDITHPGFFNEEFATMVMTTDETTTTVEEEEETTYVFTTTTNETSSETQEQQSTPQATTATQTTQGSAAEIQQLRMPMWLQIHVACMMLSWGFFLPFGALLAISFRHVFRKTPKRWFQLHVTLQVLGTILSIVGFVIAFSNIETHFKDTHQIFGTVIFGLGVLQAVQGFVRPTKPSSSEDRSMLRFIWEIIHKGLGRIVILLAWANVFLGIRLVKKFFEGVPGNDTVYLTCNALLGVQAALCVVLTGVAVFYKVPKKSDENTKEHEDTTDEINITAHGSSGGMMVDP